MKIASGARCIRASSYKISSTLPGCHCGLDPHSIPADFNLTDKGFKVYCPVAYFEASSSGGRLTLVSLKRSDICVASGQNAESRVRNCCPHYGDLRETRSPWRMRSSILHTIFGNSALSQVEMPGCTFSKTCVLLINVRLQPRRSKDF